MLIFFFIFCSAGFAASNSSCVTCHSNESLMKSMHKPPPAPMSEGEG